jgi:hypothetical protein
MQTSADIESIVKMASRLPPSEQIKIVARLSEGLVHTITEQCSSVASQVAAPADFVARLRESAVVPSRPTDAVRTLHEVREERLGDL